MDRSTPIGDALDVIQVVIMDVPGDELKKWRRNFDAALWKIRPPDRSTWGLEPTQVAETERLVGGPGPRAGDTRSRGVATPPGRPPTPHGGRRP